MSEQPPCNDCRKLQAKAKEYDYLKNWLRKRRRNANVPEYKEVYDYLLKKFKKSDEIIRQTSRNIVLVCPSCRRPFCIEPNEASLAKTAKDIEALGAKGIQCAFCHHRFDWNEAKVLE